MENDFEDFKDQIRGLMNKNHSEKSEFILFGKIAYAVERGDITIKQAEVLEQMLGGRNKFEKDFEFLADYIAD